MHNYLIYLNIHSHKKFVKKLENIARNSKLIKMIWWKSKRKGLNKAPLKDELLSNSLVVCNTMVPERTTMKPHISDMMLPTFWPSQS
jgi:hypothetical protein